MKSPRCLSGPQARTHLARARLLLLFTPDLCLGREPLAVLEAALPHLDVLQIRPKPIGSRSAAQAPCPARETWEWSRRVLDLLRALPGPELVVTVDDRVDVARALSEQGIAGVHLGQDDSPPREAREILGPEALIGLSTHDPEQLTAACDEPVDYVGFGPVHATSTKGYATGIGTAACWIASEASSLPLFPIGGIDCSNAQELARIGRAAVSSAILGAEDPARAARELRALLSGED